MVARVGDGDKRARDRPATERRLAEAVERLLVHGGFAAVTPSAVGREAGADKMLIYRYFGSLEGLMMAVVQRPGFFPDFDGLCGGDPAALLALPAAERAGKVLERYVAALAASPVALELMAWEIVERNALTAVAEEARERLGLRIVGDLFPDVRSRKAVAVTALLSSAVNYLMLRRRKITTYDGLNLHADETWALLVETAAQMAREALRGDSG